MYNVHTINYPVRVSFPNGVQIHVTQVGSMAQLVCKLQKSLYGLKQASSQWFQKWTETLLFAGYTQSHADYSLFTLATQGHFTVVLVYVDDILVAGDHLSTIEALKAFLTPLLISRILVL